MNADIMNGIMGQMFGIKIFENVHLTKTIQARFPKTRKRRILKKWGKKKENFKTIPSPDIYKTDFGFVCHPTTAMKLRAQFGDHWRGR